MDWESLFADYILDRGYMYYTDDCVVDFEQEPDSIWALVEGGEDYEVEIEFAEGRINRMYCSCPHAEAGNHCKHMAAALYYWEEQNKESDNSALILNRQNEGAADDKQKLFGYKNTISQHAQKKKAVWELIEQASFSDVKELLAEQLMEDERLLLRFYQRVRQAETEVDAALYRKQIDAIADRYLRRSGYISYAEADGFIDDLQKMLDTDIRDMIRSQQYMSAFEIMNYIFVLIGNVDMDASDGGIGTLANSIYDLWYELLQNVNREDKHKMFVWFTGHMDGSVIGYLEEIIEQIIMEEFTETEYLQEKMAFILEMLTKSEKQVSEWGRSYSVGKWSVCYLGMLEKDPNGSELVEKFCREKWNNSSIRRYYIARCMEQRNFDKALSVLQESMILDKAYYGLLIEYSVQIKDIYKMIGNRSAYLEALWELALTYKKGDLTIYRELKAQFSEEKWIEKREELFAELPASAHIDQLYAEEKLYDRLLAVVMDSSGLHLLQQYERVLQKYYPDKIIEKYRKEVIGMAIYSGNRRKYQEIVELLNRMQHMQNGQTVVQELVREWRIQYKNRPAMMAELNQVRL